MAAAAVATKIDNCKREWNKITSQKQYKTKLARPTYGFALPRKLPVYGCTVSRRVGSTAWQVVEDYSEAPPRRHRWPTCYASPPVVPSVGSTRHALPVSPRPVAAAAAIAALPMAQQLPVVPAVAVHLASGSGSCSAAEACLAARTAVEMP